MDSNTSVQPQWAIDIKKCLREQPKEEEQYCMLVFNVPKELLAAKPEAYIPQFVSIGPYHAGRTELYDMDQHYKLLVARRFQRRIGEGRFQSVVVEEFKKHDWKIRSCYNKFIKYDEENLAWVMALDAAFLLECLEFYVGQTDQSSDDDFQPLGRILYKTGTSATHHSIERDVMKLENQLPLFLLQKLLELQLGSKAEAQERLSKLLRLVCQQLSPFPNLPDISNLQINERGYVLEVLYNAIVSGFGRPVKSARKASLITNDAIKTEEGVENIKQPTHEDLKDLGQSCCSLLRFLRRVEKLPSPLQLVTRLSCLPQARDLSVFKKSGEKLEGQGEEPFVKIIPPTRDELAIPSVARLYYAGVKFVATHGALTTIHFDQKSATLYLPTVRLDANTEAILRNLVAFEASAGIKEMVFTRYTDFMNGMIDGEEDVKLLRKSGIICNHLQNDSAFLSQKLNA